MNEHEIVDPGKTMPPNPSSEQTPLAEPVPRIGRYRVDKILGDSPALGQAQQRRRSDREAPLDRLLPRVVCDAIDFQRVNDLEIRRIVEAAGRINQPSNLPID